MSMTVQQVLDSPTVQAGIPGLLTSQAELERPVRWVHVFEGTDPTGLLSGGELLLTTLVALPDDPARQRRYVRAVAHADAAGLIIELGRRFAKVPQVMVDEAEAAALPLVALHRTVKFVAITEAVHARIVNDQHDMLTFTREVHEIFTQISVAGAGPQQIVERVAEMAGTTVVLENLAHEVISFSRGDANALADWSSRSRQHATGPGTHEIPEYGWVITGVGATQGDWGRLVLIGTPKVSMASARMLLERASQALAVARLMERDKTSLRTRALQKFLTGFSHRGAEGTDEDVRAAAEALGLPRAKRYLALSVAQPAIASDEADALAVDPLAGQRHELAFSEAVSTATERAQLPALVSPLQEDSVGILMALRGTVNLETVLDRFVNELKRTTGTRVAVAITPEQHNISQAGANLTEAAYIARAATLIPVTRRKTYYRITDIGIRGLLTLLSNDERLTAFAERQLAPLLIHDDRHNSDLLSVLRQYLETGGVIAPLARTLHLSRQAVYARLKKIEQILNVDLANTEARTGLHVALLAKEVDGERRR